MVVFTIVSILTVSVVCYYYFSIEIYNEEKLAL